MALLSTCSEAGYDCYNINIATANRQPGLDELTEGEALASLLNATLTQALPSCRTHPAAASTLPSKAPSGFCFPYKRI